MVPGEILNHAKPRRAAHLLNDFRMPVQMLERRGDPADIARLHNDSLNAIAHDIACLARGDLRQAACRRLVCDFGAPLPLRGENMDRPLAEIILRVADKSYDANVITPELLQIRLRFVVHETD